MPFRLERGGLTLPSYHRHHRGMYWQSRTYRPIIPASLFHEPYGIVPNTDDPVAYVFATREAETVMLGLDERRFGSRRLIHPGWEACEAPSDLAAGRQLEL